MPLNKKYFSSQVFLVANLEQARSFMLECLFNKRASDKHDNLISLQLCSIIFILSLAFFVSLTRVGIFPFILFKRKLEISCEDIFRVILKYLSL